MDKCKGNCKSCYNCRQNFLNGIMAQINHMYKELEFYGNQDEFLKLIDEKFGFTKQSLACVKDAFADRKQELEKSITGMGS